MAKTQRPVKVKKAPAAASFSAAELAALRTANENKGARTPAEVLKAFFPEPITIGKLKLPPMSLAAFMLLERLESPVLEALDNPKAEIEVSTEDIMAAAFVLCAPVERVGPLIPRDGAPRIQFDEAVVAFCAQFAAGEAIELGTKIKAAIAAAFATVQGMAAEKKTRGAIRASAGA